MQRRQRASAGSSTPISHSSRETGASWHHGDITKGTLEPAVHHQNIVTRSLRRALNRVPIMTRGVSLQDGPESQCRLHCVRGWHVIGATSLPNRCHRYSIVASWRCQTSLLHYYFYLHSEVNSFSRKQATVTEQSLSIYFTIIECYTFSRSILRGWDLILH